MSLPVALTPGTVIGKHYIIGNLINSGGFGAVYRGIDTSEGNRPCAIKETYDVTPSARRQALMEASVLFTIRSPHLPEVYDALEANGRFYLIMQLIEGQNLLELLRTRVGGGIVGEQEPYQQAKGPCSEQEVLAWLLPIMDILQELHRRNPPVMHRDIKLGNIILTPQQTAVLVDFGLTKLYDPKSSTQTMVKAVSEGFSPIEQYLGKTSPQSDIYSMAATMYLLLTNRLPSTSINRSMHDDLIPPRQINPQISVKVERALLKALAVNAPDRFQSMHEFAQVLREPGFSAFADATIAAPAKVQPKPPPPPPAYMGSPRQAVAPPYRTPSPAYPAPGPPPGYVMAPQSAFTATTPLPSTFGQGCLWGLVQGVLAGLLVAFMQKETYFYLAIAMGFIFYVIAGLTATNKGGGSLRGAWAGYWAGITSTVIFWFMLGIGLVIRIVQHMKGPPSSTLNQAWKEVMPTFLNQPLASSQPPWKGPLIFFGSGLLLAFLLGWLGGLWGFSQYKADLAKKKRSTVKP